MSYSNSLGGDSSSDALGVRRSRRRHKTHSSVRSGSSAAAASVRQATKASGRTNNAPSISRGDARRPPPLQHLPAPHRSDIHTSSGGTASRCVTRSAAEIHAAPLGPASKQHEAPSVQVSMVEISRPPKATATCGALVPGSPAIAPWGATARCPPTRRVRPTSGTGSSPSSAPHSR
jgi:hypothetical protein